jgi:hypothetical protein
LFLFLQNVKHENTFGSATWLCFVIWKFKQPPIAFEQSSVLSTQYNYFKVLILFFTFKVFLENRTNQKKLNATHHVFVYSILMKKNNLFYKYANNPKYKI